MLVLLLLAVLVAGGGVLPPAGATTASAQSDPRYFADTGFKIDDDKIWDYFTKRGGKRTFGLPTSRTFQFMGAPTQFFQRHVLQVGSGGVRTLNLLEDAFLPYTTIGGTTFPAVDLSVTAAAPKAGSATYNADVLKFLETYAPDTWEGEPVNFSDTFSDTVTLADAFPEGGGSAGLLTLLNLEIWGLPTSKPARDPANNDFVFLRFQRGVMHYDKGCKCTQGLLLADALKAIITGTNLPDDLAAQAADSPLLGQYSMEVHNGPLKQGLPAGIELGNAFRPSLDTAAAGPVPALQPATAQSGSPAAKPGGNTQAGEPKPAPTAAPSGPPTNLDPKEYLAKVADAGKGAEEQEKEFKKGSDNNTAWASNRIERDRSWANYNSGPVTIASKIIIARDSEAAKKVFEDEKKLNEKFPEAKDKVGGKFEFNTAGDQDVGEEAVGLSACITAGCSVKDDDDNLIHRRMVFRLNNFVGVVYTFGMSVPEGNTQAYSRLIAEKMVGRIRKDL
ncbi:MAG: hypothetical protein IT306_13365 [Chloroflexi bacterium]|nr:hypothetical protein [Chloroflexota bacterium]